jgi:excisionase family DNA binding protein
MTRASKVQPLVYDTQRAAALLCVSQMHIYRLIKSGELMAIKAGVGDRSWRVTRESIDAWLAAKIAARKAEMESERANATAA